MHFVYAKLGSDFFCHALCIARQHDGFLDAGFFQGRNGLFGIRFFNVGDDNVSGISMIDRDMNDGSDAVTVCIRNAELFHQFRVADGYRGAVYYGGQSVAADFFNICYAISVNFFSICFLQTLADGVG